MKYGAVLDVAFIADNDWICLIGAKGDTGSHINALPDANIADN
jgi:hypothetical protein